MKLVALVALPFLVWCSDLDIELNGTTLTTEEASSLEPLSTTEIHGNSTERDAPHIHARVSSGSTQNSTRYGFYRLMGPHGGGGTRRVFGGVKADLRDYAATCVLLDRYHSPRCSAAVIAPKWAVTAAHCISPKIAYIKYNTRSLDSHEGNIARVTYMFRHPQYQVEEKDEGNGMDIVLLHNDLGLVLVEDEMVLRTNLQPDPLVAMRRYSPAEMDREELQVMGYGRTKDEQKGEELVTSRLRMTHCNRTQWYPCICGTAKQRQYDSRTSDTGVCSGDSGGPVLYKGVQVGVTSMGPVNCGEPNAFVPSTAVSVFTALHDYADLIQETMRDAETRGMDKFTKSESQMSYSSHTVLGLAVLLICYCDIP